MPMLASPPTISPTANPTSVSTAMTALTQRAYGPPSSLRLEQVPIPTPQPEEVLVQVEAAALDIGTHHVLTGALLPIRLAFGLRRPRNLVPGLDLAGTVVAVGSEVTRFAVGDAVLGIGRGTLAPFAAAREGKLVHKPADLPWEEAAALSISGLTAIQAVRDAGRLQSGQSVLILGASGGVGSYMVQIAKALGGRVTAVCSPGKIDFVRGLGADDVLDYTSDDPTDGSRQYDLILDGGGNRPVRQLRRALAPEGTLVFVGGALTDRLTGGMHRPLRAALTSRFGTQRMVMFLAKERWEDLPALLDLIAAGKLRPQIDDVVHLAGVPAAFERLARGEVRGKIAVRIGPEPA